ncbi:MAG: homoserine dehydrogenase [Synechococcales bacterium]|nr:homoserine dehydrogenase [Synechococcales bacterium]
MAFKIGLLGLGTVGTGTAQILLTPEQRHPLIEDLQIYRVGVRSPDKPRQVALPKSCVTTDLSAIVTDPAVDIVVEVMGGIEPARSLVLTAISQGKHVVTANKALIARHGDEIFAAAAQAGVYVLLEAAVGGGIPVIEPLKQSLCGNRITAITGIVNGTTNYILTRMQLEGGDFAAILADAQRLGYAEADPTADVDGLDAADKIAILASLAFGGRINLSEVYCEGIRQITAADITYADRLGFVIKLLATAKRDATNSGVEQFQVRVHPTLVPKAHPLASVNGVYNAILIEGDPIGQVMFFGPGAGAGPTASAVVSDILNIAALLKVGRGVATQPDGTPMLDPLLAPLRQHFCTIAPMQALETRFYARILAQDQPGVIGKLGTCFGNHQVSLESIVQIGMQDNLAEIVVVTHEVQEGHMQQALQEIDSYGIVAGVPGLLRVLS